MRQFTQQQTVDGNSPFTLTFPEGAAQTFERGAPVTFGTGGSANQIVEATTPLSTTNTIIGIAAMPANGAGASRYLPPSQGQPVTVWVANDSTLFGISYPGATQTAVGSLAVVSKTGALWTAASGAGGTFMVLYIYTEVQTGQVIAVGKFLESGTVLMKAA